MELVPKKNNYLLRIFQITLMLKLHVVSALQIIVSVRYELISYIISKKYFIEIVYQEYNWS